MFSTRIKVITGYAILAVVLLSATWMIYSNTRSLSAVNKASERLMARRDIVDSLVCSMLETANAERSVLLGDVSEWPRFERALASSVAKVERLRPMLADADKRKRLDSLVVLLDAKRCNTMFVLANMSKDNSDAFYKNKVHALQTGLDSVVIHPQTEERHEQQETVYEIVKSRRGFFHRLGDAFRRQHSDTVSATHIVRLPSSDTVAHRLDIADSVANALSEIRDEQQRATDRHHDMMAIQNNRLQRVSIQLAKRTGLLLEDIQSDEHNALRQTIDRAVQSRHTMMVRIGILGILAILTAAILVAYILRDIRRERRYRERIIEAKAETERIMQQRERLLLTITHDIKAPAASIAGFINLLGEYVSYPKAVGYLHNISCSAQHLLQLVSALLDYHQLENGKAQLHTESFVPAVLVRECVDEQRPMAMAKGISLLTDIRASDTVVCRSDAFRIKQVINNLVSNAVKYTDEGSVTVVLAIVGWRMTVSVADTGCGMTTEEQTRIFNAFTRLAEAQGKEGVGLGLSIAHEIIERLGGRINVISQKGRGSKFTVNIPVEIIAAETVGKKADSVSNASNGVPLSPSVMSACEGLTAAGHRPEMSLFDGKSDAHNPHLTVLVVDDDRLQLQLLKEMFGRMDGAEFTVVTSAHAVEAIKAAHKESPSIVFTDIEMPEMNGSEMLRNIRSALPESASAAIKFVAMTAHERSIMPQLLDEGFDACLFKPFTAQTLAATICQLTGCRLAVKNDIHRTQASKSSSADRLHEVLQQFTDGDADAERQIMSDVHQSVAEYMKLLSDPTDITSVAKAVHKAMPLLEMLTPGKNGWLLPITPEHIASTNAEERIILVNRLMAELSDYVLS